MQGSAANTFLKYHRKLLFQQTRGLLKAQLGLAVRTAVRMEGGPGLWWVLEPFQGRWPVPLQLWLSLSNLRYFIFLQPVSSKHLETQISGGKVKRIEEKARGAEDSRH